VGYVNGNGKTATSGRPKRRWWLLFIAAPAAVAIWSGWVGLGALCGFGPVRILPGITSWTLNTAITLPIGVEAYAAYALGAWMAPGTPDQARQFAKWSAFGALIYGAAGQIAYHLLAAAHAGAAPWPVVVIVSCMPVAVLGLAAALTHMLRAEPADASKPVSAGVSATGRGEYKPMPQRQLMDAVKVGQDKARLFQRILVAEVKAASNGHGHG
jgi:hypothetical protein